MLLILLHISVCLVIWEYNAEISPSEGGGVIIFLTVGLSGGEAPLTSACINMNTLSRNIIIQNNGGYDITLTLVYTVKNIITPPPTEGDN